MSQRPPVNDTPPKRQKTVFKWNLRAPCSFPFPPKVYGTEQTRGWKDFTPHHARGARISPYVEHLCFKSSFELAFVIDLLVKKKCAQIEFVKSQCRSFLERDLNYQQKLSDTSLKKIESNFLGLRGNQGVLDKWYLNRYHFKTLHYFHQDDLLQILENFLNSEEGSSDREFVVEKATHEMLKVGTTIRKGLRKK